MLTRLGKRKSNGELDQETKRRKDDDQEKEVDEQKEHNRTKSVLESLPNRIYVNLAKHISDLEIDRLAATSKYMKRKLEQDQIWHLRYKRRVRRGTPKLKTANIWKQLALWQKTTFTFTSECPSFRSKHHASINHKITGIRKTVVTENCVFVLDMAGAIHKWDDEDEWKYNILDKVVDLITDATDSCRHRSSLFVLSQSDSLFNERDDLLTYYRYEHRIEDKYGVIEVPNLRHWHKNGAPKSGDRVDVFRIESGISSRLRRVFKMTFQQAHRFISLQVSNRDYNKKHVSNLLSNDLRGKHINELQLLTVKGRVWSLTVNEPELIRNGGGAQVALKNISSRFDTPGEEMIKISKTFNSKVISGLLDVEGYLHLFSDTDNEMRTFLPNRALYYTTIGDDDETKRLSTKINIGCRIKTVSMSKSHLMFIDNYGRLWSLGGNRYGQLGLGHRIDQSNPVLVPLSENVISVRCVATSSHASVIVADMVDGRVRAFAAGRSTSNRIGGYSLADDEDDSDDSYDEDDYDFQWGPKSIKKFTPLNTQLSDKISHIDMTTSQMIFLKTFDINQTFSYPKIPKREMKNFASKPCRFCKSKNSFLSNANENYHRFVEKDIEWVNEQMKHCQCIIGNQLFRQILLDKLHNKRREEKDGILAENEAWFGNGGICDDMFESVDNIIESLFDVHSHNQQLPPFSSYL